MCREKEPDKKWLIILLVYVLNYSIPVFAQENDSIGYSFSHTDTTYTFYGRFKVVAETSCVMNICFNYEHIKALAPDASRVELIEEAENWNEIKYTYKQSPFYKNESLWHRTIDRENARVDFTLIYSDNNHSFMPRMISSSGHYKVIQINGVCWVEYFQQCLLSKSSLTALYQYSMRKKAVEFLHLFEDYSKKHCNNIY
jgi:hypothetical protein